MDYDVVEARLAGDYVVWLRFRDGTSGEVNLRPELYGPVFEPLQDLEYFTQLRLDPEAATIVWPNGADVAPEFLYDAVRTATGWHLGSASATRFLAPVSQHSDDAIPHGTAHVRETVPEISRFFGIVIQMYHDDHLPPHFHARYGEHIMKVRIADGGTEGAFPARAAALVVEWCQLNQVELALNWERARAGKPLQRIAPLE